MSKNEYINELRARIAHLPLEEQDAALTYYIEYFEEVGEENVEQAARELGSPKEAAERIIADYGQRVERSPDVIKKSSNNGCLIAAVLVLGFPVWFSLLVAVLGVGLGLAFGGVVIVLAALLCTVIFLFLGVWMLFVHFATGLFMLGCALVSAGVLALLAVPVWFMLRGIASLFRGSKVKVHKWRENYATRNSTHYNPQYGYGYGPQPDKQAGDDNNINL